MKTLFLSLSFSLFLIPHSALAQEKEGDLQLPVTDVSELERQEMEEIPTLDEIEMHEDEPHDLKEQEKNEEQKL